MGRHQHHSLGMQTPHLIIRYERGELSGSVWGSPHNISCTQQRGAMGATPCCHINLNCRLFHAYHSEAVLLGMRWGKILNMIIFRANTLQIVVGFFNLYMDCVDSYSYTLFSLSAKKSVHAPSQNVCWRFPSL